MFPRTETGRNGQLMYRGYRRLRPRPTGLTEADLAGLRDFRGVHRGIAHQMARKALVHGAAMRAGDPSDPGHHPQDARLVDAVVRAQRVLASREVSV